MNEPVENIPNDPEVTGSSKDQEKAEESTETLPEKSSSSGIGQYPLTDTIKNLADSGVRSNAGLMLLIQSVERLERDINSAREQLAKKNKELQQVRENFYEMKEKYAVLQERITNYKERNLLKNILITLGGIILGLSIPEFIDSQSPWSLIACLIGAIMLITGWLAFNEKEEE